MNETVLFSVIVPVYKVPYELLHKCIKSIINQSYQALDIILVDDGSPDDCGKICDEYAAKDKRIRVIHQENAGLSVVRNVGVAAAVGEWISFVDGDDWIESETFVTVLDCISAAPKDCDVLAWDGYADFDGTPKRIYFFPPSNEMRVFCTRQDIIDTIFPRYHTASYRFVVFDVSWARVYRRSMLLENKIQNIPGLKRAQDLIFNLHVFEHTRTMCYVSCPLYHYTMNEKAATKQNNPNTAKNFEAFAKHLEEYVNSYHNCEDYRQRMYVKIIAKINECFVQDYAFPTNKASYLEKRKKMKKELEVPIFRETIEQLDPKGHHIKIRVFTYLMRYRLYWIAVQMTKIHSAMKSGWMNKVNTLPSGEEE